MRRAGALLVVVALVVGAAACGGGGDSSGGDNEITSLKVGYGFEIDTGSVGDRVAFDKLEDETGIKATFAVLGSPRNTIVALQRGDIQIAKPGFYEAVAAITAGAKMRIVLLTAMVSEFVLVAPTDSIADLRGKRVGVHGPGDESEIFAKIVLQRAGIPPSEQKIVFLPESTNRAPALLAGRLDAAVLEYVDYVRIRREEPSLRVLANARDVFPLPVSRANVLTEKFIQEHRDQLQEIEDGLLDGYESLYTPEGRRKWIAEAKKAVLKDESDKVVAGVYDFYRKIGFWPRRQDVVTEQEWKRGVEFRIDEGLLKPPVPAFNRVFDISFWRQAAND